MEGGTLVEGPIPQPLTRKDRNPRKAQDGAHGCFIPYQLPHKIKLYGTSYNTSYDWSDTA